jgi:hypothetical protein
MACGAHRVYLPKYPALSPDARGEIQRLFGEAFDPNQVNIRELVSWLEGMFEHSKKAYLVVILPNGIPIVNYTGSPIPQEASREDYESMITSTAPMELTVLRIVDELAVHFSGSKMIQVRYVVLDDLQRGGSPTVRDRLLGSLYGEAAVEQFLSAVQTQDILKWGNLNLLAVDDTHTGRWKCYRRQEVVPIFQGAVPRGGGLDPLPFFRQSRGTVSGYRALASS